MKMIRFAPLLCGFAVLLVTGSIAAADGPALVPSPVHLLNPLKEYHLGDVIEIGLSTNTAFQKAIYDGLTSNRTTTLSGIRLYVDGVRMDGLAVEDFAGTNQLLSPVLRFTLLRDSQNADSRKSWDRLLEQIHYVSNRLQVAVSGANELPQIAPEALRFVVAPLWRTVAAATVASILFVLLMYRAVTTGMLREAGPQTAYSLGKTQMAFWGLIVALSFIAVFAVTGDMERIPQQTLILIGISGATGLSAVIIGGSKNGNAASEAASLQSEVDKLKPAQTGLAQQIQTLEALQLSANPPGRGLTPAEAEQLAKLKTENTAALAAIQEKEAKLAELKTATKPNESYHGPYAWLRDIISDANGPSFPRFQVCLWTLILGFVFVARVSTRITMPEFEQTLLLLMGISNGTYLGFKTQEKPG